MPAWTRNGRAAERLERKAQARHINAWLDGAGLGPNSTMSRVVVLSNASDSPVHDVTVKTFRREAECTIRTGMLLPPSQPLKIMVESVPTFPADWIKATDIECAIEFTDSADIRWQRTREGRLIEIVDP
jgi:hypothetical protein